MIEFDPADFDTAINELGVNVLWRKGHSCPCKSENGTPQRECQTCQGRGWYWDAAVGPNTMLITYSTGAGAGGSPREPGEEVDPRWGLILKAQPILSIPTTLTTIWQDASMSDLFVEYDNTVRLQALLTKGHTETLPYTEIVSIESVRYYDVTTKASVDLTSGTDYTVSGDQVVLSSSFPDFTAYVVEYLARQSYVAYDEAGALPHVRPFTQGLSYPRRFMLQVPDLWLRGQGII